MTYADDAARDPRNILDAARAAAGRGDYELAGALFSRLVGNPDPNTHVAGLLGLADARYRLDDEEGALQAWLTATQAPETDLAWQAWVQLAGARVRQGDLVAAARAYREAEPRAPYDERAGIQSRLGWLNKDMGNSRSAQRYFGRARTGVFTPMATYAIIAITSIISLFILLGSSPTSDDLLGLLLLDKHAVQAGERVAGDGGGEATGRQPEGRAPAPRARGGLEAGGRRASRSRRMTGSPSLPAPGSRRAARTRRIIARTSSDGWNAISICTA